MYQAMIYVIDLYGQGGVIMGRIKARAELLSDRISLPADAFAGSAKLTLNGRGHLLIENHNGICKYGDKQIIIDCGTMKTRICGDELNLTAMDKCDMLITGRILSIELE